MKSAWTAAQVQPDSSHTNRQRPRIGRLQTGTRRKRPNVCRSSISADSAGRRQQGRPWPEATRPWRSAIC